MSKLKNYVDVVIFEIVYIASDLVLKNIFKPVMLNLASFQFMLLQNCSTIYKKTFLVKKSPVITIYKFFLQFPEIRIPFFEGFEFFMGLLESIRT